MDKEIGKQSGKPKKICAERGHGRGRMRFVSALYQFVTWGECEFGNPDTSKCCCTGHMYLVYYVHVRQVGSTPGRIGYKSWVLLSIPPPKKIGLYIGSAA